MFTQIPEKTFKTYMLSRTYTLEAIYRYPNQYGPLIPSVSLREFEDNVFIQASTNPTVRATLQGFVMIVYGDGV